MDKQNALQDISYIRQIMRDTQQIMDIAWPIYIYWGIYFIVMIGFRLLFPYSGDTVSLSVDTARAMTPAEIQMLLYILSSWGIEIAAWGGLFFTAYYIFRHRKKMFNKKMFLIGMLGLSFLLIYVTFILSMDILWFSATGEGQLSLHLLYGKLIYGLYFSMVFIVFGLVYAREQFWMGYWLLIITILVVYIGSGQVSQGSISAEMQSTTSPILFGNVGLCFLIAGIMAYRRHSKQIKSEQCQTND